METKSNFYPGSPSFGDLKGYPQTLPGSEQDCGSTLSPTPIMAALERSEKETVVLKELVQVLTSRLSVLTNANPVGPVETYKETPTLRDTSKSLLYSRIDKVSELIKSIQSDVSILIKRIEV